LNMDKVSLEVVNAIGRYLSSRLIWMWMDRACKLISDEKLLKKASVRFFTLSSCTLQS
jgi:hypothetical protein